jgi:pimeloyl-ACP methyl ester carboxylesterase
MNPLIKPLAKFFGLSLAILSFSMIQVAAFSVGDHVQCTAGLNVRTTPSTSGTVVTTETSGSQGMITSGPTSANGYTWWDISWNNGYSGWSIQDYLQIAPVNPPSAITQSASLITASSATLNSYVNPNGYSTTIYFQYGTTTIYGSTTTSGSIGIGAGNYGYSISGLSAGTTYHFRVVASNNGGTTYGGDITFTTPSPAPAVQTQSASSISTSSATLNGYINPNGASTTAYFQYGTTTDYEITTISGNFGTTAQTISTTINGLAANTTYHYRIVAYNSGGITYGGDATFITLSQPAPTVQTLAASSIADNSATLNGYINPNGASTTAYFQYGTTTSYENISTSGNFGTTAQNIGSTVADLLANTLYHYRIVAYNSGGTNYGNDVTFATTSTTAVAQTHPATSVTSSSATLNGTITPPNGVSTTFYFQYGTTSYTTTSASGNTTITINVSDPITGLSPNTTYHYRVVASNSIGASYGSDVSFITVSTDNTPSITTQPQSQTVQIGGNIAFTVAATGAMPLHYQWQFNGFNLSDATNATLTLNAVTAATGGNYSVVVSNPYGSVSSVPATLSVYGVSTVILHGRVTDTNGIPLSGATVSLMDGTLKFVALTNTDAQGYYQILPALHTGAYAVSASDATHQPLQRAFTLSANTSQQDFQLKPMPTVPDTQQVNRQAAAFVFPPIGSLGEQLKIFDGTQFVTIDPTHKPSSDKMTVVMTHGWNSNPTVWAQNMASSMVAQGVNANILAWDWRYAASSPYPPEENTPAEGVLLGQALQSPSILGTNYSLPLHFIGHSLGTLVNANAINYLHGDRTAEQEISPTPWISMPIHATLLDEAEVASLIGGVEAFFDGLTVQLSNLGVPLASPPAGTLGWKSPIPIHSTWIDNYISKFGLRHPEAVNVFLDKAMLLPTVIAQHGYSCQWYGMTVTNPTDCVLGFQRSYEAQLANLTAFNFPPSAFDFTAGATYYQSSSDPLVLAYLPSISETFGNLVNNVVQGVEGIVQISGQVAVGIGNTPQQTAQSILQGFDYVTSVAAQGGQTVVNLLDSAGLQITLTTSPSPTSGSNVANSGNQPRPLGLNSDNATNTPAMVWLPIQIPTNALVMAFDFTVSGVPMDDSLVCGIGTNNLFSLQAKYIPTNALSTSRLIDVSAWTGVTNELFFGFLGGTSTNASLEINNIRFYSLQLPQLTITKSGNGISISWPSNVVGYSVQTTTNLTNWETVTNAPSIIGNNYVITNTWPDQIRFFRLSQ